MNEQIEMYLSNSGVSILGDALSGDFLRMAEILEGSTTLHIAFLGSDGEMRWINRTMAEFLNGDDSLLRGRKLTEFLTSFDIEMVKAILGDAGQIPDESMLVNFLFDNTVLQTLRCSFIPVNGSVLLIAEPMLDNNRLLQEELLQLNNQLAVLTRENTRKGRELEKTVRTLSEEIVQRQKAEAELLHYQGHLEELVHERTAELEIARDAAEAASRTKSNFLATMSHELRTPMNAIIGMSHLALATELNRRQQEYLAKINASGVQLLGIINDILDIAKLEEGKLFADNHSFSLEELLTKCAEDLIEKSAYKGLAVSFDAASDVPGLLVGDSRLIGQILSHYVSNAVKFTERGEINVSVTVRERFDHGILLCCTVRDTGIGLTEEQQGALFRSFHQGDMSSTRAYGGVGLGLAISKRLAELMGGEVGVESAFGAGSSFWFTVRVGVRADSHTALKLPGTINLSAETTCGEDASNQNVTPVSVDSELLTNVCRRIAELLKESDAEVCEIFSNNKELLIAAFPQEFTAIRSAMRAFDFETALTRLEKAMGNRIRDLE